MSVYFHQLNFVNLQSDLFVSITHRQVLLQVQYIQGNALTRSGQWLKSKPAGSRTWTVFSFQTSIRNKTHYCIVVINIIIVVVVVVVTILSRYYTTNTNTNLLSTRLLRHKLLLRHLSRFIAGSTYRCNTATSCPGVRGVPATSNQTK